MKKHLEKFYQKSIAERKNGLKLENSYDEKLDVYPSDELFNQIIENYITTYELPMGVVPSFVVNNKDYIVPIVTEEPSVIAAAAHASKIVSLNGGFKAQVLKRMMIGQIIFADVVDPNLLITTLNDDSENIYRIASTAHEQIYSLGGGLKNYYLEDKGNNFVCLYAVIDVIDAMGANTVNTILEKLANYIKDKHQTISLMSILSNLASDSLVSATCLIDPNTLKGGLDVAKRISQASLYATIDPYRAVTHNKGIMNGITGLTLATGNDSRAIEASTHAYASITGKYLPLATWSLNSNNLLEGKIVIPAALGTIGGQIRLLPKAKLAHKILGVNNAKELMMVAAALGLAQNLAALLALTTEGIQRGHMRLHARSLALEAGASPEQIDIIVNHLIETKNFTLKEAHNKLNSLSSIKK